jgi:hypothetical protein
MNNFVALFDSPAAPSTPMGPEPEWAGQMAQIMDQRLHHSMDCLVQKLTQRLGHVPGAVAE